MEDGAQQSRPAQDSEFSRNLAAFDHALALDAPLAIGYLDIELRYLWVNKRLAAMNGRSVEEHIGKKVSEVLPPGVGDSMETILKGVLDSGESFVDFEVSFGPEAPVPKGSGELVVRGSFYPVFDQELVGILGVIEDLTPTRR